METNTALYGAIYFLYVLLALATFTVAILALFRD